MGSQVRPTGLAAVAAFLLALTAWGCGGPSNAELAAQIPKNRPNAPHFDKLPDNMRVLGRDPIPTGQNLGAVKRAPVKG